MLLDLKSEQLSGDVLEIWGEERVYKPPPLCILATLTSIYPKFDSKPSFFVEISKHLFQLTT